MQKPHRLLNKLFFIGAIVAIFYAIGIQNYLDLRPQSIHIWRQTDCLAITQNYYQNNVPFLEPELYNQLSDGGISGKSAGEFPGLYYFVAQLWKLFGKHEWIYRTLGLFLFTIGLYFIYMVAYSFTKNIAFSLFVGLLLFASPTVVFYSFSFLPNVPALALVLLGWWLVYESYVKKRKWIMWIAISSLSMAMLLKVTAGISLVALFGWWFIELFIKKRKGKLFNKNVYDIILFVFGFFPVVFWYWYADNYNSLHQGKYTFNSIWPIWEMSKDQLQNTLEAVEKIWLKEYFHGSLLIISGLIWVWLLIQYKKVKPFFYYLIVAIPLGSILYLLLWFQSLQNHDYYLINIFLVIVLFWFVFLHTYIRNKWINNPIFSGILVVYLGFLIFNCKVRIDDRFQGSKNNPYKYRLEAVGELEPVLEELDIKLEDKVISIPDRSINSSLYMMNRKGYTEYGSRFEKEEQFYKRISQGAKYLIISDTTILKKPVLQPFIKYKMKEYKNVIVYDLRSIKLNMDSR